MPNIRFIDSGTPVGAYGIPKVDNATSSSFAASASFANTAITASHALFAVSASVEITKEVSSSHANRADVANIAEGLQNQPSIFTTNITSSGNISSSANVRSNISVGNTTGQLHVTQSTELIVKVDTQVPDHRYYDIGSANKYYINGLTSPYFDVYPGKKYKFNQNDSSNNNHPVIFYLDAARTTEYNTGVIYYADGIQSTSANYNTNFNAASVRYTEIQITDTTPSILYYQCYNHGYMGNAVYVQGAQQFTAASGSFSGSFEGNGSGLTSIPASGIVGLNLSQIVSGSATASISPNLGLVVNTNVSSSATSTASFGTYLGDGSQLSGITPTAGSSAGRVVFTTTNGELTAESGFEYDSATDQLTVQSLNVTHLTSSFITASTIQTSGSNIFGDDTTDTQTLIGTTKMTGSVQATGSVDFLLSGNNIKINQGGSGNIIFSNTSNASANIIDGRYNSQTKALLGLSGGSGYLQLFHAGTSKYVDLNSSTNYLFANTRFGANSGTALSTVDIVGDLNVSTNITASGNLSGSATSTSSFGTYLGDGSQLTGIETDPFPYTGDVQITGSLLVSGSTTSDIILPNAPTNAVIISGSNNRTRLHIYESVENNSPEYTEGAGIKLVGGEGSGHQSTLEISSVGSANGGGNNEQSFIRSNQQLVIRGNDNDAGDNIRFLGSHDSYGLKFDASTSGVTLTYFTNGGATVSELNMGNGTYIQAAANGSYYKIGRSSTDWLNLSSTKATFAADVSSSATSTASFGTYLGDGSQLTGIEAGTNLTQSLFVSPSGDNSTAIVGDLTKPFSTILGATGSANPGDTIIVYPGTYVENHNLYKDGVNYHFIDGAKVVATSPVEPMWGGGAGTANGIGTSFDSPISITGHGEFISTTSNTRTSAIFYIQAPSGVIEIKRAVKHGIAGDSYTLVAGFGQVTSIDSTGVLTVRGKFENSGSASSYSNVVSLGQGNINTDIVVRAENGTATGVYLWSDTGDINGTMDVYSEATGLVCSARQSALSYLKGRFETLTTNQGSNYALYFAPGYRGSFYVDAEIRGAIYINPGGAYEASVQIEGYQEISNSPGGGANVILSGHNQLSQKIYGVGSATAAFKVTGGTTTYDGLIRLTGSYPKLFDISSGIFYWKGTAQGVAASLPTTYTNPSEVSGGELIIESQLDYFNAGNYQHTNDYVFNLSGGTLDIQSKIRQHEDGGNNGIVNMTGGYLKMNGVELVHATKTGSFAYAIDLNNQTHSGSILNNCFTNLQPFNSGSFINEVTGGGTLFESHKLY
tara:strand:+ start:1267 stop:5082 length:3816 start_codon:yes stop_codon:yes gene_type:complete